MKTAVSTNLSDDTSYIFQNRGTADIEIFSRSAAPTAGVGILLKSHESITIDIGTIGIWGRVRSDENKKVSLVVITEA